VSLSFFIFLGQQQKQRELGKRGLYRLDLIQYLGIVKVKQLCTDNSVLTKLTNANRTLSTVINAYKPLKVVIFIYAEQFYNTGGTCLGWNVCMIQNVDFIAGIIINLIKIQTNEQHTVWYIFQDLSINTSVVESPPPHYILYSSSSKSEIRRLPR